MEREMTGGVYQIKNTQTNKILLETAVDMKGAKNRFEFAKNTGSCVYLKLQKDWSEQESGQFVFEVLEELKKGETQTDAEFKADIQLLMELWRDKLSGADFY